MARSSRKQTALGEQLPITWLYQTPKWFACFRGFNQIFLLGFQILAGEGGQWTYMDYIIYNYILHRHTYIVKRNAANFHIYRKRDLPICLVIIHFTVMCIYNYLQWKKEETISSSNQLKLPAANILLIILVLLKQCMHAFLHHFNWGGIYSLFPPSNSNWEEVNL